MMLIYNITEVAFCMSLRKHHDVTLAAKDVAAYTQCFRADKKFILRAKLLNISQINHKIMYIQKIKKK